MSCNNIKTSHRIIDAIVILLNVTYGLSFLKVWLLDSWGLLYHIPIIVINSSMLLLRFGVNNRLFRIRERWLLFVFILIYLMDFFQQIMFGTIGDGFGRLLKLFYIVLFMEYLYNVYLEYTRTNTSIQHLTESYEIFALYNIICVVLCAILLFLGFINPYDNAIEINSLIKDNVETLGANYYFPGHLSIATSSMRSLTQYNIPVLSGLTHEPHVLLYLIGPAFFLLIARFNNKPFITVVLYLLILIVLLITTTATAIFCFFIVVVIDQIYKFTIGKKKYKSLFLLLFVIVVAYYLYSSGSSILDETAGVLTEKTSTGVDEGSLGFSFSMLYYMLTPRSLFGLGNMPGVSGFEVMNCEIGLVSFILDMVLIISLYIKAISLCFSKDIKVHYYGLAVLYYLFHSIKNAYEIFDFQYISYILVLVLVLCQEKKYVNNTCAKKISTTDIISI